MMTFMTKTDDELAALDLTALIRFGVPAAGPMRTALFGDGAIGAAVTLDRLGVLPRAVAFLARIVRSGGVAYAAALEVPVPGEEATRTVREWLNAAEAVAHGVEDEETTARWLEAVATVMELRWEIRQRNEPGHA